MSGYDDLERQLLDSVTRRARQQRPGRTDRRQRQTRLSTLMIVLSSAVAIGLAAFAIISVGHHNATPPRPSPPAPSHTGTQGHRSRQQQARELSYINAAMTATVKKDHACAFGGDLNPSGPAISEGTPSAQMLSVLGVLRRPATAADRLPPGFYRHGHLLAARISSGVYVRYIRLARIENGVSYYIVPTARIGSPPPPASLLARCYSEQINALRSQLANVSASLRASTLSLGAKVFAQTRANRARDSVHEGVFELEFGPNEGGGGGGMSPTMIEQHGMVGSFGPVVHGVVPLASRPSRSSIPLAGVESTGSRR